MSRELTPLQLAILQAMLSRTGARNALSGLFDQPSPQRNALAGLFDSKAPQAKGLGMFASSYPGSLGLGLALPGAGARSLFSGIGPKTRHVFYSFHYNDVHRVNHVRLKDQFRTSDRGSPRVVDRSLWERTKVSNPARLSTLIDEAIEGTSTTCILAGTATWERDWVRYEIARSLVRGNGLLTVYINNCKHPQLGVSARGPDPLAAIALGADRRIYEWTGFGWTLYRKVPEPVQTWPKWLPEPPSGYLHQICIGTRAYDWIADDGAHNLLHWTDAAAAAAGK